MKQINLKINLNNYIKKYKIKIINNLKKNFKYNLYKKYKEELIIIKYRIIFKIYIIY